MAHKNQRKTSIIGSKNSMNLNKSLKIIFRMWNTDKHLRLPFYLAVLIGNTNLLYSTCLNSYVMKRITSVCRSLSVEELKSSFISIAICFSIVLFIYPVTDTSINVTGARIIGELKKRLFKQVEQLPVSYMDRAYSGEIASRLTEDFRSATQICGYPMVGQGNPCALVFTVITICCIILYHNLTMGLITIALNAMSMILISAMGRTLQVRERKVKELTAEASQNIVNALSGTIVSRMFGLEAELNNKYLEKSREIYMQNSTVIHKKSIMFLLTDFQSFISFAGVTLIGLLLSVKGSVDIPTVVYIATMQMSLSGYVSQIGTKFADLQKYIVAANRIYELMDLVGEQSREDIVKPNLQSEESISLHNLSFHYQSSEAMIFDRFTLRVGNHERIAIVGGSGGGKSSLLKLLLEFEQKDSGDMVVFGNRIEDYSLYTNRSFYSYVPQNCYLFDMTIEENVRMGKPDASDEEVMEAFYNAYLRDFIQSLPDGVKTQVGEHGSRLSGGQRQRIAIARAFLKNAPIILLDEATSALDSQAENEVQKALDHLLEGRTSIIIAHRLSTIQNADRILVLEHGELIEEGNHASLLEAGGRYAELYALQYSAN